MGLAVYSVVKLAASALLCLKVCRPCIHAFSNDLCICTTFGHAHCMAGSCARASCHCEEATCQGS